MNFWDQLFAQKNSGGKGTPVSVRVLRKQGRPFLLLPSQSRLAVRCLELYPAQSSKARAAKFVLRWLLQFSIPLGLAKISVMLDGDEPFIRFLASAAGGGGIPEFGLLAGNPAHDTQRFILLMFDARGEPVSVVKAGLSDPARALIRKETLVLSGLPTNALGMPQFQSSFDDDKVSAFAMNFIAGESPRTSDESKLPSVLGSWINPSQQIEILKTAEWLAVEKANAEFKLNETSLRQLSGNRVRAVLHHGDFAPWNIKVSSTGDWTVLDWERGSTQGIPGWDWFHYFVQRRILVQKMPAATLIDELEALITSTTFQDYSRKTEMTGVERPLLLAYLLHLIVVIKPAEGIVEARELFQALSKRWG